MAIIGPVPRPIGPANDGLRTAKTGLWLAILDSARIHLFSACDEYHARKWFYTTNLRSSFCYHCKRVIGAVRHRPFDDWLSRFRLYRESTVQRRDSKDDWGTAQSRNTIGGRRAAMRVVMDRLNGMVVVYEQDATGLEAGPRTLVFESQTAVVRVESFPTEWRRMNDEALLAIRHPHS